MTEAVDGKDAVEKYFEIKPNLVLMDITMPNMDGLEALKAIRSKDDKANVVMCSAMGQEAMVVEAVQAGIKDFIVKPFKERPADEGGQHHSGQRLILCCSRFWDCSGSLVMIGAILVLAYLCTRFVASRGVGERFYRGNLITVLEKVPVGRDQKLLLVKLGEEYLFPGGRALGHHLPGTSSKADGGRVGKGKKRPAVAYVLPPVAGAGDQAAEGAREGTRAWML